MTTRWPWTLAVTLCTLLAVATSAFAECAWVLWERGQSVMAIGDAEPRGPVKWAIAEAYSRAADCNGARLPHLRRWVESMKALGKSNVRIDEDRVMAWIVSKSDQGEREEHKVEREKLGKLLGSPIRQATFVEYTCLPDTVDPREPRGGQMMIAAIYAKSPGRAGHRGGGRL